MLLAEKALRYLLYPPCRSPLERRGVNAYPPGLDPDRDDKNWLKWMLTKLDKNGDIVTFTEDIPVDKWPYHPEDLDYGG